MRNRDSRQGDMEGQVTNLVRKAGSHAGFQILSCSERVKIYLSHMGFINHERT